DQSQSLNLFVAAPTIIKLSSMYLYAWGPSRSAPPAASCAPPCAASSGRRRLSPGPARCRSRAPAPG
ncbi:hypothetical protein, partial [Actinoplanes philippinensis]|uniref:hypothetical protein n=1 Tax=Actinoplanes philippinensis TaxID=35752 RepID=UPI003F4D6052